MNKSPSLDSPIFFSQPLLSNGCVTTSRRSSSTLSNGSVLSRLATSQRSCSQPLLSNGSVLSRLTTSQQRPILPPKLSKCVCSLHFPSKFNNDIGFQRMFKCFEFSIRSSSRYPTRPLRLLNFEIIVQTGIVPLSALKLSLSLSQRLISLVE
jgi:hypothetical protein